MVGRLGSGGNVGFGRDGWSVGQVGNVGFGRDGWSVGQVGNVGRGRLGIGGKGGHVSFEKFGSEVRGGNCRRWRAALAILMFEIAEAMKKVRMEHLKDAIVMRVFLYTLRKSVNFVAVRENQHLCHPESALNLDSFKVNNSIC
ncbi:hypothetical protein OIU76_016132 [Salix suchowensis]|nr:hypothetical protein OIU76_016132 [Salix suchowensis]